jgi:transglutaminase-like putative cysteine protease
MAAVIHTRRFLVIISIALGLLPLSYDLPVWLIGLCLAALSLGLFLDWHSRTAIPAWLRILLFIGGLAAALAVKGGETWMGLLAVMLSLKPLEGNSYKHLMTGVIFTYFLIAAGVLFHQELNFGVYVLLTLLFNTFVMLRLNHNPAPASSQLRFIGRIFIRALPITLLLFLLFPRLPGPIWGYRQTDTAVTGFSDRLAPGEFARLVHDRSAAFRVEFADRYPSHETLYWRGLVLWQNDGLNWQQGGILPLRSIQPTENDLLEYTVIVEPHNKRLLFGLDLPVRISVPASFRIDHTIMTRYRVKRKMRYSMASVTAPALEPLSDWESQMALQLPPGNPKARKLASGWVTAADTPANLIDMGLEYLRLGGFVYTTEPMQLQTASQVDDFLFRTRQGYCEHYAAAFAFLMRAAGLPARVVTGYQGGEFNTIGKYLVVRQANAHAWTEVWLPDRGWQRVDPTTVVSPARLTDGVEAALPPAEWSDPFGFNQFLSSFPFVTRFSMGWDAMNNIWDNWIISYTLSRQRTLFNVFGFDRSFRYTAVVALLASFTLAILVALLLQQDPLLTVRNKRGPVQQSYQRFCKKLARIGLSRKTWQGPRCYTEEIGRTRPDLAGPVSEIAGLYEILRYAEKGGSSEIRQLQQLVKVFRPKRQL